MTRPGLFLIYWIIQSSKFVSLEKIGDEEKKGTVLELESFEPHRRLAGRLEHTYAARLKHGFSFGLAYSKEEPATFLREMDDSRYMFLQLLHGLESGDMAYSNTIMNTLPQVGPTPPTVVYSWIRRSFQFSRKRIYFLINNYARWFSHLSHPAYVSDVMLLLARDYSIVDMVSARTDILTIKWLLSSSLKINIIDSEEIENLWNHGGRDYLNIIFQANVNNPSNNNSYNTSFLDFVVKNGDIKTLAYLIENNMTTLFDVVVSCINQNSSVLSNTFFPNLIKYNLSPESIDTLFDAILRENRIDILVKIVEIGFPLNKAAYQGITLLYKAIEYDNPTMVDFLIRAGADVNFTSKCQTSLLHVAVTRDKVEVVERLIDLGAYMYARDCQGRTPMHIAILHNKEDMILKLVENDFDLDWKDDNRNTIIYFAVDHATPKTLEVLIDSGCKINVVNKEKVTPLLEALLTRKSSAIDVLVKNGADYNYTTSEGNTLMHICAMKGSVQCIVALRGLSLPIDGMNRRNETPLYKAVQYNKPVAVRELVQSGADFKMKAKNGDSLLHVAVLSGSVASLRTLLKVGLKPDTEGHGLATPMERAVRKDDTDSMLTLLNYHANIHRTLSYSYNSTLLHDAARYGRDKAVRWLIEHGIPPDVEETNGWTPLHWAVMKHHYSTVQVILTMKANVNPVNVEGVTPLYLAARGGYPQILQELLEHGANTEIRNQIGFAPLHIGALRGHHSVIHELLNKDIDINIRTNSGNTALHLATWKGHLSIVQELLRYPADVTCTTNTGYTALHVAIIFGREEIAKELMNHKSDIFAVTKTGNTPINLSISWKRNKIYEELKKRVAVKEYLAEMMVSK